MNEAVCAIIQFVVQDNILSLSEIDFETKLKEDVINILHIQFEDFNYDLEKEYEMAYDTYFKSYPKRCSGNTFLTPVNTSDITKKLHILENIYQPEQKSDEWYLFRQNFITASNAWKAFGSQSQQNQLIYEKCLPINVDKYKPNLSDTPMAWGIKYEDVSIIIYEDKYKTHVKDYGCIPHQTYGFIAASPDGINDTIDSTRYGRMLEIKNIVNRKIDGNPKYEYWIQMQLQMEVCDLDECDFLETQFIEYDGLNDYISDGTFTHSIDGKQKGIMLYFVKNGGPHYVYAPLNISEEEFEKWSEVMIDENQDKQWIANIYWKLEVYSCVLVLRNKDWFNRAVDILKKLWDTVLNDRKDGYAHRAPKKQIKNKKSTKEGCIIKLDV
tara:strand:- start:4190 stop:5338 length:1149 start_codon:yes stop_codon:yes gene_type:complete